MVKIAASSFPAITLHVKIAGLSVFFEMHEGAVVFLA
jgi:hypothetical protein